MFSVQNICDKILKHTFTKTRTEKWNWMEKKIGTINIRNRITKTINYKLI